MFDEERMFALIASRWHISMQLLRFLISGGTALVTELVFLYVLTQFFGIWYMFSFVVAFAVSFVVSFSLQKFWTFADKGTKSIHIQASSYLFVTLANLAVNAVLLYVLVQFAGLWYIYAQILIDALIAISSFFIYKFVIFRRSETTVL